MDLIAGAPTPYVLRPHSDLRTTQGGASFFLLPGLPRTGISQLRSYLGRV